MLREKSKTVIQREAGARTQNPEPVSLSPDFPALGSFLFLKSSCIPALASCRAALFIKEIFLISLFVCFV